MTPLPNEPLNWEVCRTYVTINDQLPAVKESADYLAARMDTTLQWAETDAFWSNDEYRRKAISSFQQAHRFYQAARERAATTEGNQSTSTTIAKPEVWLCAGDRLSDLLDPDAKWPFAGQHLSGIKFYVGQLSGNRRRTDDAAMEKLRQFARLVRAHDLQVAVESDERFYRETLQMVDAYLKAGGNPSRWFVQSWYPFPKQMTPESAPHSMMSLVKAVIGRVLPDVRSKD